MSGSMYEELFRDTFPFWNEISDEERELVRSHTNTFKYKKGESVHSSDGCSGVFMVRSGCLRVYIMSEEGKDITLYRLHPGDMCMLAASCVIQSITFDVFVDAEEDSECCVIEGNAYSRLSEGNPTVKIFSLETAVSRFSDVMWVMQQILFMSMDKRLAIFLYDEALRTSSDVINLTHEQIARYMGSAREVVSRMLKYFSNEGIVESSRKEGIRILDRRRLRDLAL
ncbi:MAG: Crp/Fnr family transcriptional regulator [Ruminococcaceae bacterium]|nr:Crp/Fnr family transcriptional regulator [Oscillospiraceae bacterium]